MKMDGLLAIEAVCSIANNLPFNKKHIEEELTCLQIYCLFT